MKKIRPCSTSNIYRRQTSEYAEVGDMTIANPAFSSSAVANKDHGNTYMKSMIMKTDSAMLLEHQLQQQDPLK